MPASNNQKVGGFMGGAEKRAMRELPNVGIGGVV